jgi:hypothetical protein
MFYYLDKVPAAAHNHVSMRSGFVDGREYSRHDMSGLVHTILQIPMFSSASIIHEDHGANIET